MNSPSEVLVCTGAGGLEGAELSSQLHPGENVLAELPVDLTDELHFAQAQIFLTSERLLNRTHTGAWVSWPLTPGLSLKHHDQAGVVSLELLSPDQRLARWHLTLKHQAAALRLVGQFEQLQRRARDPSHSGLDASDPADDAPSFSADALSPPSTWVLLRLERFARPYRKSLAAGFLLTLACTAASLVPTYLTIPLMDDVLIPYQSGKHIEPGLVLWLLAALLGSAVLAWGLGWARSYVLALVSERISADLRTTTFNHLLQLSLDYFGGKRTGDLIARIGSETDSISVYLSLHAMDFATDVIMILMTAAFLFYISPTLAVVTLLPLPLIAWLIQRVRDKLRHLFEKIGRAWSDVTNVLADAIPGIRVVKAFAQESRESQRFHDANRVNLGVNDRLNKTWSLFTPTVSLLTEVGLLVVWAFGIWLVSREQITVGVLMAFIGSSGRFYGRLDSMSRFVSVTQKTAAGAKRIFDILDHVSNVPEPVNPVKVASVQGGLALHDVGFRYGSRSVIRGLSLNIQPGEMIGLVGHSGSGKSTLVNLMCRFYDVSAGSIQLDGLDIRRFAVADYRRHIGLVLQEPFLFFGTIAENIAYGKPAATPMRTISSCGCPRAMTRWWASVVKACLAESASAFPLPAPC
jgi:ATP-binding cassette, subfamily B, bacterial